MHIARTAALAVLITASSAWGATAPEPGRYFAEIAVTEVRGAECPDHRGAHYQAVVRYFGFDARRVTIRIPIVFYGYSVFASLSIPPLRGRQGSTHVLATVPMAEKDRWGARMFILRSGYPGITKLDRRENTSISLTCGTVLLALAVGGHGAQAATVISTAQQLQNIQRNLAETYVLGADVDASVTATWNGGAGFLPIGNSSKPFTGTLDGKGHVVINLFISSKARNVGLFGVIGAKAEVKNVGLIGGSVTGTVTSFSPVGALAGANDGNVTNCWATTTVIGQSQGDPTGGLVGVNNGTIAGSYASGPVSGGEEGGLIGMNTGTVRGSYATGNAVGFGGGDSGGLVGSNNGAVQTSYATGNVVGTFGRVGGLVGFNETGAITNSYASGTVLGITGVNIGGLVGENSGKATASYATGWVAGTGSFTAGGLVGVSDSTGSVVKGYWDTEATGQTKSAGGVGETTAQLMAKLPAGFAKTIWSIVPTQSYPYLRGQALP